MNDCSISIIGLPSSGKTTFLAALWHLVCERDIDTVLGFHALHAGDAAHLNAIANRWREAKVQYRTAVGGNRTVSMSLTNSDDRPVRITFPDIAGEAYRRMWEDRDCDLEVAEVVKAGAILLFIHADTIGHPTWVTEEAALARALDIEMPSGREVDWHPRLAPTQVQLVDLLQLLCSKPLNVGPRRLAIMLSAWDKAEGEGLTPQEYLEAKLPLLAQYLSFGKDGWVCRTYGLSAQGGEYDPVELAGAPIQEAERLRNLDCPSQRIRILGDGAETHDLTEPLAWLMG